MSKNDLDNPSLIELSAFEEANRNRILITVPESFSQELQREKERLNYRNEDLAQCLGVSLRQIKYWISGERRPYALTEEGALARLKKAKKRES